MPQLARCRLKFAFDELDCVSNALNLFDLFRGKLQTELLFQRQHQIEVLDGVPGLDGLRRRCCSDFVRRRSENIGSNGSNLIRDAQSFPPLTLTTLTHSG